MKKSKLGKKDKKKKSHGSGRESGAGGNFSKKDLKFFSIF